MVAVVPPPKAVGESGKQQQQSLLLAQSKPAPRPVPVKRKRVEETDNGSPSGDCPTKKPKLPPAITASRPRSFGPRSSGKRQAKAKAKAKAVVDSDVPACRTRSKATAEQSKGMQTRQTRK